MRVKDECWKVKRGRGRFTFEIVHLTLEGRFPRAMFVEHLGDVVAAGYAGGVVVLNLFKRGQKRGDVYASHRHRVRRVLERDEGAMTGGC